MAAGFHIEQVFWTPVIIERLAASESMNAELEQVILHHRQSERGVYRSNVGGWHSNYKMLTWAADAIEPLKRRVIEIADANCVNVAKPDPPEWRLEAWANVSEDDGYSIPHAHGASYWSAIYYVRVDEGEGGDLVLHDPRTPATEMHAPHLRFRESGGERFVHLKPEAGMLIVIPSWLVHSVTPWKGGGLRISVAINLACKPPA